MPGISKRKSSEVSLKQLIDDIVVNDEQWNCLVTMLIETRESQMSYTLLLNEACENGCRKSIHLINREKMLTKLRLASKVDSSYAVKLSPSVQKIRESIQTRLQSESSGDTAKDTGLTVGAMIKWMIYEMRLEWLARIAAEREEPQPKTKLRRRGEEWRDRVYVDDAPENGPEVYILLTGFHDAQLPLELIENQVPLNCILRLDDFHFDSDRGDSSFSSSDVFNFSRSDCQTSDREEEPPMNFWKDFDKSQCPNLAIRCFCPPNNLDDLYDRISYVLYEVHELVQAHAAYLCAMRVIHVYESRPEKQIASAYETHLSSSSSMQEHCKQQQPTTVDIIVEAMLRQVQISFQLEDDLFSEQTQEETEYKESVEGDESSRQTSSSGVNSAAAFARLTEKLRLLNLKYELISDQAELILHCGDGDLLNVCCANDQPCNMKHLPRIPQVCHQRDLAEIEACKIHLPGVLRCGKEEGISRYRATHLLNLLGLRKIFKSNSVDHESSKVSDSSSNKESYYLIKLDDNMENEKHTNMRRYQSEVRNNNSNNNKLAGTKSIFENFSFQTKQVYKVQQFDKISGGKLETPRHNENTTSESSLNLNYNQIRSKRDVASLNGRMTFEKERESGLTTTSDSSCRCVEPRVTRSAKLSEARRLSSLEATALLRSFEKCTSLFGLIDARESLGLETSASSSSSSSSSYTSGYPLLEFVELLASPWILLDCFHSYTFSDVQYFAPTDSVLLLFYNQRPGRVAERRVTCALRTPLCLRDFCEYVIDEERDWLQRRMTRKVSKSQIEKMDEKSEVVVFKDEDFLLPDSLKAAELLKRKDEEMCKIDEEKTAVKIATPTKISPSSTSSLKNNGLKVEPTFEFIGYDLGAGRVQVTNLTSSFEASDGTRLCLTRDTWLHGDAKETMATSLEIEVPDCCSLRYHEVSHADNLFHLTTKNQLIVAFAKKPRYSHGINPTNELMYDIQISWPSGLIVKPVEYPAADYPFYVLQYYLFKDFGCESIKDESHRKYLHNGDVVKFFNDGSIVVLRPNGIVITFERSEEREADGNSISDWEKSCNHVDNNIGLSRETSSLLEKYSSEWQETKELRYVVLELDGRRYEVADGRIVRELDRLRANLAEEYCKEEKFARRADGTDALFTSDAELIVSFPDGTRTLSSCTIDDDVMEGEDKDGFLLVSMYNRAEHPKYASVAGHRLSMPHQLEFQLDEFELQCSNDVRVEATSESVSISRQCECSPTSSQVSFDLATGEKRLATLRDKASRLLLTVWREDARFELTPEICEEQQKQQQREQTIDDKIANCRMFAVSRRPDRDGFACEYLHRSLMQRHFLQEMFDDESASLISCLGEDGIRSYLGLASRIEWTMDYKIRKAKPSVVYEGEDELPFKATTTTTRQRFLRARLVEDIGTSSNDDEQNLLISMQKALLRYWREVATGRGKAFETGTAITCECRGEIESWMKDVALGRVGTIDPQSYEAGRQELKEMRAKQDEERTWLLIDRSYARDKLLETDILGRNNE